MASPSTSRLTETVSPNCVNDQPTATDSIGFEPYVQALIAFLTHEQTKPPLVVSIEGPWGSGKSSFMLQLEAKLKEDKQNRTIRFNAWRFEKEESLWAAFALQFTVGLAQALSFWRRQWCHLKILWLRFNFKKGWPSLFRYILLAAAFLYVGFNAGRHIIHDHGLQFFAFPDDKNAKLEELLLRYMLRLGGLAGYVFLGFLLTKKITETIGNPLEMDLKRFLRNPKYDDHIDFIDAFHDDFKKIVETYTPKESRVFVFVDDLDRCEVPKAAELMQALNLLISESAPVFYILGIDREKVAAGLAIKFEKLVPYLRGMAEGSELYYGLEFGFSFLEKFIQIPFEVPHPALNDIRKLLKSLQSENTSPAENTTESGASPPLNPGLLVQLGPDSETVLLVVEMVTPYLEFNPRRVKQFLNLFRLRALLASQTGLFGQPRSREFDPLTLFQLGKITAISLCWSGLIADLQTSPKLLSELQELASSKGSEPKSVEAKRWASQSRLMKLIAYGASEGDFSATVPFNEESFDSRITRVREYGLYRVDVERLLRIAPPLQRFSPSENMKVTKTEMSESKHPRTGDWERDWSEEGSGVEYRPRSRKKSPIDIQDLSDDPGSN